MNPLSQEFSEAFIMLLFAFGEASVYMSSKLTSTCIEASADIFAQTAKHLAMFIVFSCGEATF